MFVFSLLLIVALLEELELPLRFAAELPFDICKCTLSQTPWAPTRGEWGPAWGKTEEAGWGRDAGKPSSLQEELTESSVFGDKVCRRHLGAWLILPAPFNSARC